MSRIVKLPAGYRQVDYIESTGTQYVDTEFKPNSNTRVVMDAQATNTTTGMFFGGRESGGGSSFSFVSLNGVYRTDYGASGVATTISLASNVRRTIDKNKNVTTIETETVTNTAATFSTPVTMTLLAVNAGGTISYQISAKLYSCQIYDNGTLIRDYIPCKTNANVAGLYDMVEGKFYGNAGTGAFLYGAPVVLPKGYRRLTHIESSGTQYVDTGFKPSYNSRVVADVSGIPASAQYLYGVRDTASGTAARQFGIYRSSATAIRSDYFGSNKSLSISDASGRTTIDQNGNVVNLFGSTITNTAVSSGQCTNALYIFALNNVGTAATFSSYKLHSCQIYDNGTLTRDYVPCITDGGEVGLYDDLNGVFYGNAGTGVFIAGKKIYTEDDITKLEYVESTGSQYVDTEFKPNNNTRVVIDAAYTSVTTVASSLCGARISATEANYALLRTSSGAIRSDYNNVYSQTWSVSTTERRVYDKNKETTTVNGTTQSYTNSAFQVPYNLYLLASNNGGTLSWLASAKLYASQIYDADFLTRDYYPATADGEIGLWDACTGVLYTSATSTALRAGPEIKYTPDMPTDFAISEISDSSVTLAWSGVEDALGYRVYRNALLRAELTETGFTDDITPFEYTDFAVTAFNDLGESDPARLTVNYFPENPVLHLITDRTYADVTRADYLNALWVGGIFTGTTEELAEWFGIVKGAYNAHDFNRVGAALRYVANRMSAQGYIASASVKTDWRDADTPTPAQTADYLAAVAKLREVIAVLPTTPAVPNDVEDFTSGEANAIEQILIDLDMLLTNISLAWVYSGEIYSGEV